MIRAMVRPATEQDAPRIAAIYNHYVEFTTVTFEESPVAPETMAERVARFRPALPFLVLDTGGEVAAFAYASPWKSRCAYRHTAETSIYLDPASTGQGLGTLLYSALIEELRDLSLHSLIGGITLPNEVSRALHEKMGFEKVAHFKEVGWKFGKWIDVGYWELILKGRNGEPERPRCP